MIIDYYLSGFSDQQLFHFGNLFLYGGLFDILAVVVGARCRCSIPVRHLLCAMPSLASAQLSTARLVAGPRAGAIAAFALAVCGPWYGSMFNHTKDIPFAAAMMGATYFLCRATTCRGRGPQLYRTLRGFARRALGQFACSDCCSSAMPASRS